MRRLVCSPPAAKRLETPFGGLPARLSVQSLPLEPSDRIVFLTDGMPERNAASFAVSAALADAADQHPRTTS